MNVKTVQSFVIEAPFGNNKPNATAEIGKDLRVEFYQCQIHSYFRIHSTTANKKYTFSFGCQAVTKQELKDALKFLEIGPTTRIRKGLKNNITGKFSQSEYVESSENYFITDNGKAYLKTDYTLEDQTLTVVPLKTPKPGRYEFRGHVFYSTPEKLKELLKYLVELIDAIDEQLKSK
jgi:hypothetical protein